MLGDGFLTLPPEIRTVVSVTPLPVDRDSRTRKIAASFAGLGFRSVVVENRPSRVRSLPPSVETVTLFSAGWFSGSLTSGTRAAEDVATRVRIKAQAGLPRWLRERLHLAVFIAVYFVIRPLEGLFRLPRADLYYLHEYRLFPMLWLVRKLRPAPMIYDAHDFYRLVEDESAVSPFWRRWFGPFLGRMERWCISHAEAVVTVSEGVGGLIDSHYGVTPVILRNCHDGRLDGKPEVSLRQAAGVGPDDFLIAVVGNRKPGQAVTEAIQAMAQLPDHVHLAFVGRFYESAVEAARRLGVGGRVHAVGPVPPEHIVPFIRSADAAAILYFPHTDNNRYILPNGLFQSLSAGLPLLYPELPEIARVVGAAPVGRRMNPLDPRSIRDAVLSILEAPTERSAMKRAADKLAENVSWAREEERLARLIGDAIGSCESPPRA